MNILNTFQLAAEQSLTTAPTLALLFAPFALIALATVAFRAYEQLVELDWSRIARQFVDTGHARLVYQTARHSGDAARTAAHFIAAIRVASYTDAREKIQDFQTVLERVNWREIAAYGAAITMAYSGGVAVGALMGAAITLRYGTFWGWIDDDGRERFATDPDHTPFDRDVWPHSSAYGWQDSDGYWHLVDNDPYAALESFAQSEVFDRTLERPSHEWSEGDKRALYVGLRWLGTECRINGDIQSALSWESAADGMYQRDMVSESLARMCDNAAAYHSRSEWSEIARELWHNA